MIMNNGRQTLTILRRASFAILPFILLCGTLLPASIVDARQAASKPASASKARAQRFDTPQQACDALIQACDPYDLATLVAILGPDGHDIVDTGEPARDKEMAAEFAAKARAKTSVVVDAKTKNRAILSVGDEDWPFPVPIVRVGGKWYFDSKAGIRELLYRRIGRNELDAIQVCRGYVEAQDEYALTRHDGSMLSQYAQRIISTPGKQDGLVWRNPDGSLGGPISEEIGKVIEQGYTRRDPFHGYYFKILKGQGPAAPLGQLDYVIEGAMIGGFALIAAPAQYRVTGVKTFMVSNDGVVYQKDLGPNTLEIAKKIERFNPDKSWSPVLDE